MKQLVAAIVVAGGSGRRLGFRTPKAFVRLAGLPLFEYSLRSLSKTKQVDLIVLVIPPNRIERQKILKRRYPKLCAVVAGGRERPDSVKAGLSAAPPEANLVLVHDAARPLVNCRDISAVILAARRHGAAILAEPMVDTVKRVDRGFVRATLNRNLLWRAQTPQAFLRPLLDRCYSLQDQRATDDSSLVESLGVPVAVVAASGPNFKITTKIDLEMASCLLRKR